MIRSFLSSSNNSSRRRLKISKSLINSTKSHLQINILPGNENSIYSYYCPNNLNFYSPLPIRHQNSRRNRILRPKKHLIDNKSSSDPIDLKPSSDSKIVSNFRDPSYSWTDYDLRLGKDDENPSPTSDSSPQLSSVNVPSNPNGTLQESHPSTQLLSNSALIVVRQLEMLNVFIGFEQANRYKILSPSGLTIGYLIEQDLNLSTSISRQFLGTHRALEAIVFDLDGNQILKIKRPFSLINSKIFIESCPSPSIDESDDRIIGEAHQEFHLWRRRYNLSTRKKNRTSEITTSVDVSDPQTKADGEGADNEQFARIDSGLLSWDFYTQDRDGRLTGSINRNFTGFAREIFTDTGQYVIRFDAIENEIKMIEQEQKQQTEQNITSSTSLVPVTQVQNSGLTLDQRAVILATAVSIDFDYFSRTHRGGLMPPMFFGGGSGDVQTDSSQQDGPSSAASGFGLGSATGFMSDDQAQSTSPDDSTLDQQRQTYDDPADQNSQPSWSETPIDEVWKEEEMVDPWGVDGEDEEFSDSDW